MVATSLKETLARFCTGVVLITGRDGEEPAGFTAQSLVSVSLDPPLVSFCPAKTSESWPRIRRSGRFCVNVLSQAQHQTMRVGCLT
jgi:flavin reductase (DIM6/NTAB) family NADH-FMN oxidoreductase RutF